MPRSNQADDRPKCEQPMESLDKDFIKARKQTAQNVEGRQSGIEVILQVLGIAGPKAGFTMVIGGPSQQQKKWRESSAPCVEANTFASKKQKCPHYRQHHHGSLLGQHCK